MKSMRILNLMVAILLVVGMLPLTTPALAAPRASDWNRDDPYVPGEVLVSFEEGLSASAYMAKASALAGSVGAMVSQQAGNLAVLQFDAAADVPALVEMLKESGMAAMAQPNYIYAMPETAGAVLGRAMIQTEYRAGSQPNSPVLSMGEVSKLTHLVNSKATPVFPNELPGGGAWGWDYAQFDLIWPTVTSTSYKVCVVDTGIDAKHIDLLGRVTNLYDYVNDDILPNDDNGHGTAVAGVISAKTNSGTGTAMGASTASLFAVKSLNYEGVGTSFSVTAGVYKCAAQTTTKVINLSFSMDTEDEMLYRAIYYAIVTKKMLVVAAAGNDSSSTPVYPAAWADETYNTISIASNEFYDPTQASKKKADALHRANVAKGLISVAAGRPVDDYDVWVDLDQSGDTTGPGELFNSEQCATGFTNYGAWISIAAPGESIYTTTPVSYPFYLNIEEGAAVGYDTFSGTSFAAPFVSAAAARYWGLNITKTKDQVKAWLTENGDSLTTAVDDGAGVDQTLGYRLPTGGPDNYGLFDPDNSIYNGYGSTGDELYKAPFCWPTGTGPNNGNFGTHQEMSGVPYLNIAKALGRGGLWAAARFAADGSPAVGALVSAYDITSTTTATLRDSSKLVDPASPWVMLINLPVVTTPKVTVPETAMKPVQYKLGVSLTGFTTGVQYFNGVKAGGVDQPLFIAPGDFGSVVWGATSYLKAVYDPDDNDPNTQDDYNTVSLAPFTHFRAVLDWKDEDIDGIKFTDTDFGAYPNLDMYLWLPENPNTLSTGATNSREGVIGTNHFIGDPAKQLDTYDDFDTAGFDAALLKYGVGTLLDPLVLDPSGLFFPFSPWAQYLFDGGYTPDIGGKPTATVEYLAIKSGLTLSTTPFLKPKFVTGAYTLMVTDYSKEFSSGADFINGDINSSEFVAPVVRLWSKGYLVADVRLEDAGGNCFEAGGTNDWWKVLTLTGTAPYVTKVNTCATGGAFMPYLVITP